MAKRVVSTSATARYFIEKVIIDMGGAEAVAALEPKKLRKLIKDAFCLQEACKCDSEQCKCLPVEKRIGLKYRRQIWSREFKKILRKRAPNAHLNRVLEQAVF